MGLSSTHKKSPERRDRTLLISAVTQVLLTSLGSAGDACELDRTLKANTVKKRTMSLLNQWLRWFRAIPNMREDRLVPLVHEFGNIVANHAFFPGIFGFI